MKSSLLSTAALGIALSLSAASASALNIGGIEITPGFHVEFGSVYENLVNQVGQELTGYGEVLQINGSQGFCNAGAFCELTYQFGGFILEEIVPGVGGPDGFIFSGGWINFYVGTNAALDFNPFTSNSIANDIAEATDGVLWLTLAGHSQTVVSNDQFNGKTGTLFADVNQFGANNLSGQGRGFLDVDLTGLANGNTAGPGALANNNLDTNNLQDAQGLPTDFLLGSSFNTTNPPYVGGPPVSGTAEIKGNAIPEPGTLTLLGLGLLGLGAFTRRKAKA